MVGDRDKFSEFACFILIFCELSALSFVSSLFVNLVGLIACNNIYLSIFLYTLTSKEDVR